MPAGGAQRGRGAQCARRPSLRSRPRLCSSPPPVAEEDVVPLSLPAPQLAAFAAPQFSLEPIEPAPRPASPPALLAVPAVDPAACSEEAATMRSAACALLPTNGAAPPPGEDEGSEGEGSEGEASEGDGQSSEGEGDGSEGEEDELSRHNSPRSKTKYSELRRALQHDDSRWLASLLPGALDIPEIGRAHV